jgi:hypothetical protein
MHGVVYFTGRRESLTKDLYAIEVGNMVDAAISMGHLKFLLIVDNAPCHSSSEIAFNAKKAQHPAVEMKLLRLSPYSYKISPIELMWSCFKSHVKSILRSDRGLVLAPGGEGSLTEQRMLLLEQTADNAASHLLGLHDFLGYFTRCQMFMQMAIRLEDLPE